MNKTVFRVITVLLLFAVPLCPLWAQEAGRSDPSVALSFNPVGFILFGPMIHFQVFPTSDFSLNAHLRFPSLGALSWVLELDDDSTLDDLSGFAGGAGMRFYLGSGKGQTYLAGHFDYGVQEALYNENGRYEWTSRTESLAFFFGAGYRFRFGPTFFMDTGGMLGVAFSSGEWEYTDPNRVENDPTYSNTAPYVMGEVNVGFEF